MNILVVEDNDHDYKKLSRSFRNCDFTVNLTRCIRAEEAIELINNNEVLIDILLTDFMMPGMNGLELSEYLLEQDVSFPIILLTGEGDENIAVRALKLGVFDYLPKDHDVAFAELLPQAVVKAVQSYATQAKLKEYQVKNERLSLALEQSKSAVMMVDLDKNINFVNYRCEELSGYKADELVGANFDEVITGAAKEIDIDLVWGNVLSGLAEEHEIKKYSKSGNSYWVRLSITKIKNESLDTSFILVVENSINEQREIKKLEDDIRYRIESEKELTESKNKEKQSADQLAIKVKELGFQKSALDQHAIVSITDVRGNIIYANQKFSDISQYSFSELVGQNHRILKSDFHPDSFYKSMWRTITQGLVWHGEIQNLAKDGSYYWVSSTIVPMLNEKGKPKQYISIRTDITESKKQQYTLELMAHYDVLTKLPNRILLADRFSQAIAHSKRSETALAVCFLDLDYFKPINDTYGHEVGDELLIAVSERIQSVIRDEDTVSRHGGDEFILLLGNLDSLFQCETLLERIISSLAQPYFIRENEITIGASVGFTLYPHDNADFDTLVRHADHAMYQAKLAGRNTFSFFNAFEDQKNIQQYVDLHAIKTALKNKELCLYFQPKINMKTGIVFGVEALIRWLHPKKSMILPLDFLPVIEGTNLEVDVGDWVINEALKQQYSWLKQGVNLEVSVNISSYHLQSESFCEQLSKALSNYPELKSEKLQLEVLESSALGDTKKINSIIRICQKELGVKIALDDFGTGYSSLAHLKNLTVNTIKIDQSFVRDILDDPNDYAIIDGVIGLADSFHRKVIAEGVETTEHGLMLLNMGCEDAQGYGIAKPMPATKIIEWLQIYTPKQEWIAFAHKELTLQESRKQLFKLVFERWVRCLEINIHSSPDNLLQWPILVINETPCSIWIKREQRAHLFEDKWLRNLKSLNNEMTEIANMMAETYQLGNHQQARDFLDKFKVVVKQVETALHSK